MPGKHAMLSASSCYRWLACPPSAQECANLPDTSSEFARQGTDAHTLCEFKVKTALGQKMEDPTKSLTYFDEEMAECTDEYAQFVMECLAAAKASCKDPLIMIEQRAGLFQVGSWRVRNRRLPYRGRRYPDGHRLQDTAWESWWMPRRIRR
jgi:hypothetical protein